MSEEYQFRIVEVSTQEGYALWSKTYDQPNNALIAVEEPRVDALLAELPMNAVLDVGTGTGRHALKLARRGVRVTAIDQSMEMLAVAQKAASIEGLTIDFQLASLGDALPFPSNQFNFLICALMLCHVPNLAKAIQEFSRVLQDGGHLLITTFHPDAIERGWRTDFRSAGRRYVLPNMPHSRADYLEALATAGFATLQVIDIPLSEVPDGYLPEALMHESGDRLLCLIVFAQK